MSLRKKSLIGLKWNTFSAIISFALQTTQLIVLSRLFDPNIFGLMGMLFIVIKFSNIFIDLGISNAIIQSKKISIKDLSSLYFLNIFLGLFLAILLYFSSGLIASLFKEIILEEYFRWLAIMYFFVPFGQQYRAIFQKKMKFEIPVKIEVFSNSFAILITIFLAFLNYELYAIVFGQLINAFLKTTLLVYFGRKEYKPIWYFNFKEVKQYLSFGLYQTGEGVLNYVNTNIDGISIGRILGATALGIYDLSYNIIIIPSTRINPILSRVFFPAFSLIQNDIEKLKRNFYKLLKILNLINFPIFIGLFLLAEPFVFVVFGEKWVESIEVLKVLCGVGLLRSLGNPISSLVYASGKAKRIFTFNIYKILIQVPLILVGAHLGGIIGVAWTFLGLQILFAGFNYFYLIEHVLGPSYREYLDTFREPTIWSLIMAIGVLITKIFLFDYSSIVILISSISIGTIIYIILLLNSRRAISLEIKKVINDALKNNK